MSLSSAASSIKLISDEPLGFKKVANRATTQVMMKTGMSLIVEPFPSRSHPSNLGHVEKTNDRDYEVEER